MSAPRLPVVAAGQPVGDSCEASLGWIAVPQPSRRGVVPWRRRPSEPRYVERIAAAEIPAEGVWVGLRLAGMSSLLPIRVDAGQVPAVLGAEAWVRVVGLHAAVVPGIMGVLSTASVAIGCDRIEPV